MLNRFFLFKFFVNMFKNYNTKKKESMLDFFFLNQQHQFVQIKFFLVNVILKIFKDKNDYFLLNNCKKRFFVLFNN